jgi:hypothetical protein
MGAIRWEFDQETFDDSVKLLLQSKPNHPRGAWCGEISMFDISQNVKFDIFHPFSEVPGSHDPGSSDHEGMSETFAQ